MGVDDEDEEEKIDESPVVDDGIESESQSETDTADIEMEIPDESAGDLMDGDIDVDELIEDELEKDEEELEEIEQVLEEELEIIEEMDEIRDEEENTAGFKRGNSYNPHRGGNGNEKVLNGGRANGVEPRAAVSQYMNVVYLGIGILILILLGMCLAHTKKEEKGSYLVDSDYVPASSYG